jgi:hypothetical protein
LFDIEAAQGKFLCVIRERSPLGADWEIPQQQPDTAMGATEGSGTKCTLPYRRLYRLTARLISEVSFDK